MAAFYPLDLIFAEKSQVRSPLLRGLRVSQDRVLRIRLRVEHQLEGLIVREVAARVVHVWVHLEITAAQLREVSQLCRRQPLLVLVRMLGV